MNEPSLEDSPGFLGRIRGISPQVVLQENVGLRIRQAVRGEFINRQHQWHLFYYARNIGVEQRLAQPFWRLQRFQVSVCRFERTLKHTPDSIPEYNTQR